MSLRHPDKAWINRTKAVVFLAGLMPLGLLIWRGFSGGLTANPIEFVTHTTGWWALTFLMITLAVTPVRRLLDIPWLLRLRRMLGLYAFFYASLHFLTWLVVDQFFDWDAIVKDIIKRPYITIGFSAFVLMLPLAATSTNAMVRRLGAARWQTLHRAVYFIAILGAAHFWWLVKKDITEPLIFAAVLAVLLAARLVFVWRKRGLRASTQAQQG
ncbi:MAG TPA: protein-methionine-sulfoxide reductase heme-binding subunit MsrQ [Burkholderiales bacterium]|nr:protein-methionine-sulfoxide reductase heme-binding subunit MsrQ [Burkholderiales bacterium]